MFSCEKIIFLRIHDHTASIWGNDSLWDSLLSMQIASACARKLPLLKMNRGFWAGLRGTVGSQLVCPGLEPPDEAPIHGLAFCAVSKQSPAFALSRPAM